MNINYKPQYIFSSKIFLKFFNEKDQKKFEEATSRCFEEVRLRNIILTLLLGVIGLNILISKQFSQKEINSGVKISLYFSIFFCFCFLLSYCFISKSILFLYKRRMVINQFIECLNFIILKLYFDIILVSLEFTKENLEILIFISSSIMCILSLYAFFFLKSFSQHLVCNLIILLIDCLMLKLFFSLKSNYLYFATVASIVTNLLIVYTNDLFSKINFLLQENNISKIEKFFMKILDGMNECVFTFDKEGNLNYSNRRFREILISSEIEPNLVSEHLHSSQNIFNILKINKFIGKNDNGNYKLNYFDALISSINMINDGLLTINQNLFQFIYQYSQEDTNKHNLCDKQLLKFLSFFNQDKAQKMKSSKTKLTRMTNCHTDMINNSELPILVVKTLKNSFAAHSEEIPCKRIPNNQNLVKLGRLDLKKFLNILGNLQASEELDENINYFLYCMPIKSDEMVFYIEEKEKNNQIIDNNDLTKFCKSLFFSKISHEFKNPICSMLEIIDSIGDDINWAKLPKFETSVHIDPSNTLSYMQSPISYFDKLAISGVKDKNTMNNSPITSYVEKIYNLKCLVNILQFLIKDFTSYSHLTELKEEVQFTESAINITTTGHAVPPTWKASKNTVSNLSGRIKGSIFNKECDYHQVINKIMEIFNSKIQIDNKESKFSFHLLTKGKLPQILEIEKDLFESFIFNSFYHFYKNIDAGKVTLTLKFKQEGVLTFSFLVRGSFNINSLNEFLLKESEKIDLTNISGKSYTKNVPNENYRKLTTSFESYHLENLMKSDSPVLRNNYVDSFNNNFHSHLSCLYAEKLGAIIKLKISNKKEFVIKFSLQLDTSKLVLKSPEYFLTRENIISNKSDKLVSEVIERSADLTQRIGIIKKPSLKNKTENKDRKIESPVSKKSLTTRNLANNRLRENFKIIENEIETSDVFEDSLRTNMYEQNLNFEYEKYMQEDSFVRKFRQSETTEKQLEEYEANSNDVYEMNKEFINMQEPIDLSDDRSPNKHNKRMSSGNSFKKIYTGKHSDNSLKGSQVGNSIPESRGQSYGSSKNSPFNLNKKEENDLNITKPSNKDSQSQNIPKFGTFMRQGTQMSILPNFMRVLICDDEILIQNTVKRFFNKISSDLPEYKFDIHCVDNGFECLNTIYKFYNLFKYIDILVIDETMPYMKGSHLIYLLKSMIIEANFRNITIISYTSYNSCDKIDYIYMQGADYVITKPISYEQFKNFFLSNLIKS